MFTHVSKSVLLICAFVLCVLLSIVIANASSSHIDIRKRLESIHHSATPRHRRGGYDDDTDELLQADTHNDQPQINPVEHGSFPEKEAKKRTRNNAWSLDRKLATWLRHFFATQKWRDDVRDKVQIADMGAGGGHYARAISTSRKFNITKASTVVEVTAYDNWQDVEKETHGRVHQLDLAVAHQLPKKFDWIYSIEVAEHIPPKYEEAYVYNLISNSRYGFFVSWAKPGQGGIGHYNELAKDDVIALFKRHGMIFCADLTNHANRACERRYIGNNILAFAHDARACVA